MARPEDHIELANKNHEALLHVLKAFNQSPEWVTTIAFYKSLQIVDALCLSRGWTPCGHDKRLEFLQRIAEFKPLYKHYRVLYSASTIARYLYDVVAQQGYSKFSDQFTPREVVDELIKKRLVAIEQYSTSIIDDRLKKLLVRIDPSQLP